MYESLVELQRENAKLREKISELEKRIETWEKPWEAPPTRSP